MRWSFLPRPGHPQASDNADEALERYIARGPSLRERLARSLEHAPWWAISATLHAIALLILWLWPLPARMEVEERVVVINPKPIPERERLEQQREPHQPDLPEIPENYEISMTQRPQEPGIPEPSDLTPGAPTETKPSVLPIALPEIIALANHSGPPRGPAGASLKAQRERAWKLKKGEGGGKDVPALRPVVAGLVWLARAQLSDGSWDATRWGGDRPYRVGMTGMAILAFEGCAFTHRKGPFRNNVRRALDWLAAAQRKHSDGRFPFETFYEHGIATMAVCEAYAMTDDPKLRPMAQAAINYLCRIQPDHGGFRYGGAVPLAEGDMSVTGWQIMALKSAVLAKLEVPRAAIEHSHTFLKNTLRDYGTSAYLAGRQESGSLAMTSVGMACRCFLNELGCYNDEILRTADYLLSREAPDGKLAPGGATGQLVKDLYYTYYSSLAMCQVRGEYWREWQKLYYTPLVEAQVHQERDARGRFVKGSWDPQNHRWAKRGGRVYTTAMAVLALETPYRFISLYRVSR